jgi:DNA-directed RNA polymerase specialized sigma24 family protein
MLTQVSFGRLLEWLDDGTESNGERYLEMRRRLVAYFDRRGRTTADALADETLNRIARTLNEEGQIATRPPARYCYVIARFVLLEDTRNQRRYVPFDETWGQQPASPFANGDDEPSEREQRLDCLDQCLEELNADQRDLVVEYYRDAKRQRIDRRREIAARLGISMNALGIRLSRLRAALEVCITECCSR